MLLLLLREKSEQKEGREVFFFFKQKLPTRHYYVTALFVPLQSHSHLKKLGLSGGQSRGRGRSATAVKLQWFATLLRVAN